MMEAWLVGRRQKESERLADFYVAGIDSSMEQRV